MSMIDSSRTTLSLCETAALGLTQAAAGAFLLPLLGLSPWLSAYSRRVREGAGPLLGYVPEPGSGPLVWLHGVSQGESMVAFGLAEQLKREVPDLRIGFTTTHPDVLAGARRKTCLDVASYAPVDFLPLTSRAFHRWQPRLIIISETDFWPGWSALARLRRIPLVLINGRISEKLHRFYSAFPALGRLIFGSFSLLAVQTETDQRRLLEMGAEPQSIRILGNVKADLAPVAAPEAVAAIARWRGNKPLIIFGSLHPVEFDALRPFLNGLLQRHDCRILIAPRNMTLAREWQQSLQVHGIHNCMRSKLSCDASDAEQARVVLLDTMGELAALYALGHVAFVGGSLAPTVGGHNPIEAIRHDVPTLVGPFTRNFADLIADLQNQSAIAVIHSADEAISKIEEFLRQPAVAAAMAQRAGQALKQHQGAMTRTLHALRPFLPV